VALADDQLEFISDISQFFFIKKINNSFEITPLHSKIDNIKNAIIKNDLIVILQESFNTENHVTEFSKIILGSVFTKKINLNTIKKTLTFNLGNHKKLNRNIDKISIWAANEKSGFCPNSIWNNEYKEFQIINKKDFLSPIHLVTDQVLTRLRFFKLAPAKSGLTIDVIPSKYVDDSIQTDNITNHFAIQITKKETEDDNYLFSFFNIKLGKKENHLDISIDSFADLDQFLLTLPDFSIKKINFHADMNSAIIDGIEETYYPIDSALIQRKFEFQASINMLGCKYGKDYSGTLALKKISEHFFGQNPGTVNAFIEKSNTFNYGIQDANDIYSFGGKKEFTASPTGQQCLIFHKSVYSKI